MAAALDSKERSRVPLLEGLLSHPLGDLGSVRLMGTKCSHCGEVALGTKAVCPNCGTTAVKPLPLSDRGVLWSFTVARHRPPGDYRGAEPFSPFGLGLIELPDGVRVYSPIDGPIDALKIGMELRFKAFLRHDEEHDVVTFAFEAVGHP